MRRSRDCVLCAPLPISDCLQVGLAQRIVLRNQVICCTDRFRCRLREFAGNPEVDLPAISPEQRSIRNVPDERVSKTIYVGCAGTLHDDF